MALSVRFLDGERAGTTLTFGDDAELVVFGRDEASCHVVFPPGEKQVGRQHCALKRVLGRYRLVIDTEHAVTREDGEDAPRPAHDEQEVDGVAVLRLGPDGPRVRVEVPRPARLGRTVFQGMRRPPAGEVAETAVRTARASRRLVALTLLLLVVAGGAGAWSLLQTRESVRSLTERQGSALAEVRTKVTGLEEQLARMEPGMKEVLRAAARSAYLVLLRRADGTEVQVGTA